MWIDIFQQTLARTGEIVPTGYAPCVGIFSQTIFVDLLSLLDPREHESAGNKFISRLVLTDRVSFGVA
jgi:hypothetical protein